MKDSLFQASFVFASNPKEDSGFSHLMNEAINSVDPHFNTVLSVDCYPLYDVLVAADLTTLDVLMLDVQGPELQILRTLPWDLVDIKVSLNSQNIQPK